MENKTIKVLLIEDNPGDARLIRETLAEAGANTFLSECAQDLSTGLERLAQGGIDVVLCDLSLPDSHGTDTFLAVHSAAPRTPVIVLSGLDDETLAVKAVRDGAQDYMVKGQVDGNLLSRCIRYAIERKRSEEELRDSEERYRSLIDSAMDMILTVSLDGRFTSFNPVFETVTGWSREECIGKPLDLIVHPDDLAHAAESMAGTLDGTIQSERLEVRVLCKSGEHKVVAIAGKPRYKDGEIVDFYAIAHDVTERNKAEEALRKSEERYRLLAENVTDVIWVADTKLGLNYMSPSVTSLLGLSPEEAASKGMEETMTTDSFATARGIFAKGVHQAEKQQTGTPHSDTLELEMKRRDGSTVWVESTVTYVCRPDNDSIEIVGVSRDITERRQAKEKLHQLYEQEKELREKLSARSAELERAYQELMELDKMKDSFLSTVSHELRTPLTSIKGFAEILLSYGEEDKETQREFLTIINDESDRLTRLINDVLDLSRIESGRMQWETSTLAIPAVIETAVNATRALSTQSSLKLHVDLEPDLPPLWGDKDRLVQVMTNLIGNAIKFTPDGGEIRIAARLVNADEAAEATKTIQVSVADTGVGIAPQDCEKVFEKFRQVGDTLTDKPKGTGLGLSICKEIVEHHHGAIWVESGLGNGSTFHFTLPLTEEMSQLGTADEESDATLTPARQEQVTVPAKAQAKVVAEVGKTVLVVDDEMNIRRFLNHELTTRGHHVVEAVNGKEAIDLARECHPALITLDVALPDISGFDVTAVLKNDPNTRDIPILIVSVVEEKERGYSLGANDYVTKPFDSSMLMDRIERMLSEDESKVLVVDDDQSIVKAIKFQLEKRGLGASVAYNGEEALAAIERDRPDLVVLDVMMPKMDGYEVMKALRSSKETADIPIIVITGVEIDGGRVKALSLGATEYISKSEGLRRLFEEIDHILGDRPDERPTPPGAVAATARGGPASPPGPSA